MAHRSSTPQQFLRKLQIQAQLQSTLSSSHILPKQTDWLLSLIGNHPWQTVVVLATISTLLMLSLGKI